jgi:hypothetical protein
MVGERDHGKEGERIVERLLRYGGWEIIETQPIAHGHHLDLLGKHPDHDETLFEVKVWADPKVVGTDNVKKAIADAYDLRAAGEQRPYVLVLSHELAGLHQMMLSRAMAADVITDVWVLALVPMTRPVLL